MPRWILPIYYNNTHNGVPVSQQVDDNIANYYFNGTLLSKRFGTKEIAAAADLAHKRFPSTAILYVTDQYQEIEITNAELVPFDIEELERLDNEKIKVFLCAFESDEKLVTVLKKITSLKNAFYFTPLKFYPTSRYFHRNDLARTILQAEQQLDLPKFEVADYENLIQAIDITRHVVGDYVEIGVYQGRSAHLALKYMKASECPRKSFFIDVFDGFTYPSASTSPDALWVNFCQDTSVEFVSNFLCEFEDIEILKLDIIDGTVPASIKSIAVCNIDVDMYEAVLAALLKTAPLMSQGGIIVVEDQGHTPALAGGYLAVCEFLETDMAKEFIPIHMGSGQMFLIRR
ncbi:TylF/MycF family methyltransferase [Geomonas oryzisoli]|uniref:TylF/MycF family methyltransferase n=1 Tax=Geomonas oryzisoli TaxID=2847992 RepID=A0ABX8J5P2_9BACT|nr:TylF/MycF family methyltransferase [Geomonas oryzisoli]QWV92456.1 TylF/MycF family methyltransferase [Geomonas oryzisoli]